MIPAEGKRFSPITHRARAALQKSQVWSSCKVHDAIKWRHHREGHATPQFGRNCDFWVHGSPSKGRIVELVLNEPQCNGPEKHFAHEWSGQPHCALWGQLGESGVTASTLHAESSP